MKILLDQGLPRSTVRFLEKRGIDAEHAGDLGMSTATDTSILAAAETRGAILVTLDADFHALLALSGATSPSVVRIRIERLNGHQFAEIISQILEGAAAELQRGAAVSVTKARIRVRLLPVRGRSAGDTRSR